MYQISTEKFVRPKVVNLISRYERCRERTERFRNHVVIALRCKEEETHVDHKH